MTTDKLIEQLGKLGIALSAVKRGVEGLERFQRELAAEALKGLDDDGVSAAVCDDDENEPDVTQAEALLAASRLAAKARR